METKTTVMLVQKSTKTGRIAKNEEYELGEFINMMVNGKFVHSATWWHKLVPKSYFKFARQSMGVKMEEHIKSLVAADNFGRKRK